MDTPEALLALRGEIVESQKTQAEFLKWKLIAVGAVSSISLGLTSPSGQQSSPQSLQLLLCSIPLICAYTDFISLHIMIRIVTIGTYLKGAGSDYEQFVFRTRERGGNPFIFETAALHGSSLVFNLVLIGLSFSSLATGWIDKSYLLSGLMGLFVTVLAWVFYTMRAKKVSDLSKAE